MIYKVIFDTEEVDLNKFFNLIEERGLDICFADNGLFVHGGVHTDREISYIMEETKNKNYFVQKIKSRPTENSDNSFSTIWVMEKWDEDELKAMEKAKQKELKQMMKNINAATAAFKDMVLQIKNKQGGSDHE